MKNLRLRWSAPLLALALAGPAHALTTLVSPLSSAVSGDTVECAIVNASSRAIDVRIEVVGGGSVLVQRDVTVASDQVDGAATNGISSGGLFCRFAGAFPTSAVRASLNLLDAQFRTTAIVPAY